MTKKKQKKKLAVLDFETDSFKHGRVPEPFACELYDGEESHVFWGRNCVEKLLYYLESCEQQYLIYAHNGGKFDFFFLLKEGYLENPIRIINGRLVKAMCGCHELRDSYAIIPIPLSAYQKDEIDYSWFEEGEYDKHKREILDYLHSDCDYLYKLVDAFVARFGDKLTIGSTAIDKLRELHPFDRTREAHDEKFRPYYFGGRVECFKHGIITAPLKVYDVNSMYPYVMREYSHPVGQSYGVFKDGKFFDKSTGRLKGIFKNKPYFMRFTGRNKGALPTRTKQGLDFNVPEGEFFACSHEIIIAIKHKLIEIQQVHEIYIPDKTIKFNKYVDIYSQEKIDCKKSGDKVGEIFAKLLLNSAYGKFGQNPNHYKDFCLHLQGTPYPDKNDGWEIFADYGEFEIWEKPSETKSFFDVAVAASITSAARSVLLDAIHSTRGLVYCDTDSLICEHFEGNLDNHALGAWKFECEGDQIAIAGKKLYALFKKHEQTAIDNNDFDDVMDETFDITKGECVKLATKGVRLDANDIWKVANGETILWENQAPSFSLMGEATFIKREIRRTA